MKLVLCYGVSYRYNQEETIKMNLWKEDKFMVKVTLKEQECKGTYKFDGQILYTKGMEAMFGDNVAEVIFKTMLLICQMVKRNVADYFQVAYAEKDGEKIKFYIIDDIDHITFLLPSEY